MSNSITSDFTRVLLAVKKSTLEDCNVADVYQVISENTDGTYICNYINNKNIKIAAIPIENLNISVGDVVLIIFTNTDFRTNVNKIKAGKVTQTITENMQIHSTAFGVIVGIIFHREVE